MLRVPLHFSGHPTAKVGRRSVLLSQDGKGLGGSRIPRNEGQGGDEGQGMRAQEVGKGHREGQPCLPRGFLGGDRERRDEEAEGGFGERWISFGVVGRHFSL